MDPTAVGLSTPAVFDIVFTDQGCPAVAAQHVIQSFKRDNPLSICSSQ
jgi:hypothetical protein